MTRLAPPGNPSFGFPFPFRFEPLCRRRFSPPPSEKSGPKCFPFVRPLEGVVPPERVNRSVSPLSRSADLFLQAEETLRSASSVRRDGIGTASILFPEDALTRFFYSLPYRHRAPLLLWRRDSRRGCSLLCIPSVSFYRSFFFLPTIVVLPLLPTTLR